MRSQTRFIVGAIFVVGIFAAGLSAANNSRQQWSIVNLKDVIQVKDRVLMGPILIVHDDIKMGRGEPCTTFYRFEPGKGAGEELVSFHCRPVQRDVVSQTKLTLAPSSTPGCKRLLEYQIAGDAEAHKVPLQ